MKKKTGLIYHHLGLGDTIICNGIINNYLSKIEKIFIFCKSSYYDSVEFLYKNNFAVSIIPIDDLKLHEVHILHENIKVDDKLVLGYSPLHDIQVKYNLNFDKAFYKLADIDFEKRFSDFKLVRDYEREKRLFDILNLTTDEYIFIHDDKYRNFNIDKKIIKNSEKRIVRPEKNLTSNIFDYCYIIENASEIHVIDSCFKNLCEHLDIKTKLMFYHTSYILKGFTHSQKSWIEI
jgi:hypothetical protein